MTPERWREVTRIYGAVVSQAPDRRAAAVAELCGPDAELRREIESLLGSQQETPLLDRPAAAHASVMQLLTPGSQIGVFRIDSLLGVGGMGEVYRARDTKLNRDVAIKILPASFTNDPERVARFRREAQVLAALNHPHIAHIYGSEEANGTQFLVLELVDGECIDQRIARGRIPVDEALGIARQIAEALEAAHDTGIIHRDLKPANIALTKDGQVKVLDFGLAKAVETTSQSFGVTHTPTITSPAMMTGAGVILGTAAYMAPEQAKGRPADKRSDLWAFGCVLYEMLTGTRAFGGDEVSETLAAVLMSAPDWTVLPAQTPAPIRTVLRRCLEKDPTRRLDSARTARLDVDDALVMAPAHLEVPDLPRRRAVWIQAVPWSLCGLLIVALGTALLRSRSGPLAPRPTSHLEMEIPAGAELFVSTAPGFGLSPDGTRVAFVGVRAGLRQLYVRRLDQPQAVLIRVPNDLVACCVFSPQNDAVLFMTGDRTLRKVTLADSFVAHLANEVDYTYGATWTDDDRIIFVRNHALWEVPAAGGTAKPLVPLASEKQEVAQAWPAAIGGKNAILFTSMTGARRDAHIELLSFDTGKRQVILPGTFPLVSDSSHLLFFRDGALLAVPFDTDRLTLKGTPVQVVDDVAVAATGGMLAAVSRSGSFVYASTGTTKNRLVWVTREGLEQPVTEVERGYYGPRLAPDGRRIAVSAAGQLWVYDIQRATFTPITSDETVVPSFPVWAPDGTRVIFRTGSGLQWVDPDGVGHAHVIPGTSGYDYATSISPDGTTVALLRLSPDTSGDIYTLSLNGAPNLHAVVVSPAFEGGAVFSPDGRWLAYASDDSGQMQVYVRAVTGPDRRWPVSTLGGRSPRWSRSGRELFYRDGQKMMVVTVSTDRELTLSPPTSLFEQAFAYGPTNTGANYDVSADGQRFLMVKSTGGTQHLNVVLNWGEELKARVPTK